MDEVVDVTIVSIAQLHLRTTRGVVTNNSVMNNIVGVRVVSRSHGNVPHETRTTPA
jgi:hypothetical protein